MKKIFPGILIFLFACSFKILCEPGRYTENKNLFSVDKQVNAGIKPSSFTDKFFSCNLNIVQPGTGVKVMNYLAPEKGGWVEIARLKFK